MIPLGRRIAAGLAALALPLVVAGCGSMGEGEGAQRETTASDRSDTALLRRAQEQLIADCMRGHGFWYATAPERTRSAASPSPRPSAEQRRFPYGIDDIAWARTHGFGDNNARDHEALRTANPNVRYVSTLPSQRRQQYQQALGGSGRDGIVTVELSSGHRIMGNRDGCMSQAQQELYGDFDTWFKADTMVNNLASESGPRILADPAYRKALSAWSACMTRAGHPAGSPGALREGFVARAKRLSDADRDALERDLAVTEARCVDRTGLVSAARRLEKHYAHEQRRIRREEIDTRQRMRQSALPRAERILSDSTQTK
ncbi:hypothetical protein [Streptomyces sp. DH24]|uniref:hypothetical protein n=1 Tax=Streptomyces sp. DH24 TaxID=3040123 RepID=UPI002441C135|nr:hypothetical protein [Streptomyces sp. DH24]MDG9720672.1 hypothetical protein [Streptomyces sp. DH24]